MTDQPGKNSPLLAIAALAGTGLLLRQWKPTSLDLPKADNRDHLDEGPSRRVRQARDGVAKFLLPSNVIKSLGTSLLTAAGGLIALRMADEFVDEDERLF